MNNPIPDPVPDPVPYEGHRSTKNIQTVLVIAYASLALNHSAGLQKTLSKITTACLYRRVKYLLAHLRIRINRRIRNSKKSGHLRKLCSQYIALPQQDTRRKTFRIASQAMEAATSYPVIGDAWHKSRKHMCKPCFKKLTLPIPTTAPSASSMSIFFWNCNGGYNKDPKRTLIRETAQELKADIVALVETKTADQPLAPCGYHLISYRAALTPPGSTSNLYAAGGISVNKTPSADFTARTALKFTGYIEAVATSLKSPNCTFTLITGYIPPTTHGIRGAFTDTEFFTQLRSLYGQSLLFVADANVDIASWTGRGTTTIRKMLDDGWELHSSPAQPTATRGRCIDIVLSRNFPHSCSINIIPLTTNDHQGLHITVKSTLKTRPPPNTCGRHAAIRLAKCSVDRDHPHYGIAVDALSRATRPNESAHEEQRATAPPLSASRPVRPVALHSTAESGVPPSITRQIHFHPVPADPSHCFDRIVKAVNDFQAAEKDHPYRSSDPLFTELKLYLTLHYERQKKLVSTTSHRRINNLYRVVNHAATKVSELKAKIRKRAASQDACSLLETAAQSATINAITRRVERAFNPNKTVLNVAELSTDEAARHAQFWSDRWSQPFLLPPDRTQNIHLHMHPPPGTVPPSTFSITHRPDGSIWLPDADEVKAAIHRLQNNRAPGPSGIPVDFFKLTADFTDDLVQLFEDIITTQATPSTFENCRLILLHKTGPTTEPKNYRPINLTEAGFRILESLLRTRLEHWSESVLHEDQYGFRAGQSTMSALFRIITSLHAAINRKTPLHICFLDAVKAFDRVPHAAIMESLIANGLCPTSCRLLHSVISNHVSSVINLDDPSASIQILIECGVLQGGILSPLFFNMFADSMLTNPAFKSMQALYADDRTLMDSCPVQMQSSLHLLEEWASTRNVMHDGNEVISVNSPPPALHIHEKPISTVPSAICLGLMICDSGKIERANLIPQTSYRTLKITSVWHKAKDHAPFSMLKEILHRYMLPTTLYGSAFFTDNVGPSLDKFIFQILRRATHSHATTNTTLLCEFTGTIRPMVKIQQETISVLSRMLDNTSSHVREAVQTQFNLGLPFATKARRLLESLADFPICGPSLSRCLDAILSRLEDPHAMPYSPTPPPPFIPERPSHSYFIAFTDGSTNNSKASGCSTIILIGDALISSSFPLPDVTENNAAEITALKNLLDQISTLKSTSFPDIISGTLITDSLNTVDALHGNSLLKEAYFRTTHDPQKAPLSPHSPHRKMGQSPRRATLKPIQRTCRSVVWSLYRERHPTHSHDPHSSI